MAQDIQIFLQNHQGTLILDTLNEFRKDVLRSIFRDMVVPSDSAKTNDALREHSTRLAAFLCESDISKWKIAFETWYGSDCPAKVSALYKTLQSAAQKFCLLSKDQPKHKVWSLLYSSEFSETLRISASNDRETRPDSLAGLFGVVAVSIDKRMVRLIQPHDIVLTGDFHTLQCCFPVLDRKALTALAMDFQRDDFVAHPLVKHFSTGPAIFRGNTAVCYDTGYYTHDSESNKLLPKAKRVFNACFLQIRPFAEEQEKVHDGPVGFFQLQCCLPGLMEILVPKTLGIGRDVVLLEDLSGEKTLAATTGDAKNVDKSVLVEFSSEWWESDRESRNLCTFWRLRELTHGWPRRLFNILELSKRQASLLEDNLSHRYRQQLQKLNGSIDQLLNAAALVERSSNQIRAAVRDPSDAIFGIHQRERVARLFDENTGKLMVTSDFSAVIKHNPVDYDDNADVDVKSLRAVIALLMLEWAGADDYAGVFPTYNDFMQKAVALLDESERTGENREGLLSRVRDVLVRTETAKDERPVVAKLSALLMPDYSVANLRQGAIAAKGVLFTPFKFASTKLGVLPIAVAAGLSAEQEFAFYDGQEAWTGNLTAPEVCGDGMGLELVDTISPALPKHVIQFLVGITGEANNRESQLNVVALALKATSTEKRITITFNGEYVQGDLTKVRGSVSALLNATRDWRIEAGAFGNFTSPYNVLATSLLGVGPEWTPVVELADGEVMKLKTEGHRQFCVSAKERVVELIWSNA